MDWKEVEGELGEKCLLLSSRIAMKEKKEIDLCFLKKAEIWKEMTSDSGKGILRVMKLR